MGGLTPPTMVSVLGLASKVMFVRLALESKLVLSHANEPPLMCTWPGATTGLGLASSSSSSFCSAGQGCVVCEASVCRRWPWWRLGSISGMSIWGFSHLVLCKAGRDVAGNQPASCIAVWRGLRQEG